MSSAATAGAGRRGAGRRASAEGRAATEKRQESAKGPGNRGQSSNRKRQRWKPSGIFFLFVGTMIRAFFCFSFFLNGFSYHLANAQFLRRNC